MPTYHEQNLQLCTHLLRQYNREYLLCALKAPPQAQPPLIALYVLKDEWQKIEKNTTEPTLKHIKQKWWYDKLLECHQSQENHTQIHTEHPLLPIIKPYVEDILENGFQHLISTTTDSYSHHSHSYRKPHIYAAFIKMACGILNKKDMSHNIRQLADHAGYVISCAHSLVNAQYFSQEMKNKQQKAEKILREIRQKQTSIPNALFPAFLPLSAAIFRLEIIEKRIKKSSQNKKDLGAFFPLRLQWRLHKSAKIKRF